MKTEYQFWMVYSPQGGAPTHMHSTAQSADREAQRLANQYTGREFYVLKALRCAFQPLPQSCMTQLKDTNGSANPDIQGEPGF